MRNARGTTAQPYRGNGPRSILLGSMMTGRRRRTLHRVGECRGDFPQLELLNLAACGAGKLSHDLHTLGPEMFRHLCIAQIGLDRGEINRRPGASNAGRTAALAEPRIRKPDDRDGRRVLVEQIFDFDDGHVFHAPDLIGASRLRPGGTGVVTRDNTLVYLSCRSFGGTQWRKLAVPS